ncbi:MAG: hypothetical protein IPM25_19615 [Chloracidobacterium sp.]|nr:hypothetical protein [Chloracidobacterium sp.]
MNRLKMILLAVAVTLTAGAFTVDAQIVRRATNAQVQTLLNRLENNTDMFRSELDRRMDNSRLNNTQREDVISRYLAAFENSTDDLRNNFADNDYTNDDVTAVLNYGWYLDDFVRNNRLGAATESRWRSIRTDLNTLARYYQVSWNWNRSTPPYPESHWQTLPGTAWAIRANDRQMRSLLSALETKTDRYRRSMDRRLDNSRLDNTRVEDRISDYLSAFENATDDLRNNYTANRPTADDATKVLNFGWYIDDFMRRNRMGSVSEREWTSIRRDLNMLASYYAVSWNWNRTAPFPVDYWARQDRLDDRLTGTFRLNLAMSDNVYAAIDRALARDAARDRPRLKQNLERRLASPRELAIAKDGRSVTMGTNLSAPVTFIADGSVQTETGPRGRTTRTSASMDRNMLTISTEGDRTRDFWVTVSPMANNRIKMTRKIYLENRDETITVSSVYDQVSPVATWPTVDRSPAWTNTSGSFYIPNGTKISAVLRTNLSSKTSRAGDRFTMEVTEPFAYRGAIISGRLTEIDDSGRLTGRAELGMDFDTITLRNKTYTFDGIIDSAWEADGDSIRVDNEGTVRDGNQTTRTVTRAGIGAVLGALIGAIAGGGEGAAVGAGIGAGAGVGSVLIQGRGDMELEPGSRFSITATAPQTVGRN